MYTHTTYIYIINNIVTWFVIFIKNESSLLVIEYI